MEHFYRVGCVSSNTSTLYSFRTNVISNNTSSITQVKSKHLTNLQFTNIIYKACFESDYNLRVHFQIVDWLKIFDFFEQ